jgi:hypothetical protein
MNTGIESTTEYHKFASIVGNRNLNMSKIEKICNDVANGFNMLAYYPIICYKDNDLLKIIDGQHRFEVSKRTETPVYFIVCENISLKQIAILNSRGEKWKPTDFLNCYIKLGIKDYEDVRTLMNSHHINIKLAVDLLMDFKHHVGQPSTEAFQDGNFKSNYLTETIALLDEIGEVFGRYKFCYDRYLVGAFLKLKSVGKTDFEELKAKIDMAPMMMDKHVDLKGYLNNIERVYNYKNSIRRTIF